MRFRGGGVGHKSTRNATDHFLHDRSLAELSHNIPNASETLQDRNINNNTQETEVNKEQDFGYQSESSESDKNSESDLENPFEEQDHINTNSEEDEDEEEMIDEWEDLDVLGPEDGETMDGDVEDLGFTDL